MSEQAIAVIYCVTPNGHEWSYATVYSPEALIGSVARACDTLPDRIKIRPVIAGRILKCEHRDTVNGFCFRCWHEANDRIRTRRKFELQDAFTRGLAIRQGSTVWTTAGVIFTAYGIRADAVFLPQFQSDPTYLAEHLENREFGFGFETQILRGSAHE